MIKINLKVTGMEASDAVREYLDKKLEKVGDFAEKEQDEVILRVEIGRTTGHHEKGDIFRAEINTRVLGQDFYAATELEDLYAAIDKAQEEILREIKRAKGKQEALVRRGGRRIKEILRKFYR